jgi:hypothetical protein
VLTLQRFDAPQPTQDCTCLVHLGRR